MKNFFSVTVIVSTVLLRISVHAQGGEQIDVYSPVSTEPIVSAKGNVFPLKFAIKGRKADTFTATYSVANTRFGKPFFTGIAGNSDWIKVANLDLKALVKGSGLKPDSKARYGPYYFTLKTSSTSLKFSRFIYLEN